MFMKIDFGQIQYPILEMRSCHHELRRDNNRDIISIGKLHFKNNEKANEFTKNFYL